MSLHLCQLQMSMDFSLSNHACLGSSLFRLRPPNDPPPSPSPPPPSQREIYEAVLDANIRVMKAMRPGVSWVDMHDLAHRCFMRVLSMLLPLRILA